MKKLILLFAITCFLTSCNVTESIIFNEDMSGKYATTMDLAPMMEFASENRPSSAEGPKMEKMDTTIVFNDFYEAHKDSIATLSEEQRAKFETLKGMVLDMNIDEANNVFNIKMGKTFEDFNELGNVFEQMDETMNYVKAIGNKDGQAPSEQLDVLTKTDKVKYTFENNTFSRFEPNSMNSGDSEESLDEMEEEGEKDEFSEQFEMQFQEIFSGSYYTLIYKFPRKVKSVSKENAVISEDGKTVTYKVDWDTLKDDDTALNLDVVLED
ncbi:hypothetical protein [Winogradskyella ouciana]|uniref:hypothetical protein n=1 Tax=Winogradskyella ouciana TaxID=2608631 RepID=UPI003D2DCD71